MAKIAFFEQKVRPILRAYFFAQKYARRVGRTFLAPKKVRPKSTPEKKNMVGGRPQNQGYSSLDF